MAHAFEGLVIGEWHYLRRIRPCWRKCATEVSFEDSQTQVRPSVCLLLRPGDLGVALPTAGPALCLPAATVRPAMTIMD